jgi:hypothetical protein
MEISREVLKHFQPLWALEENIDRRLQQDEQDQQNGYRFL